MSDTSGGPSDADLISFARAFSKLAERAHHLAGAGDGESISERALEHLGLDADSIVSLGQTLPVVEHPNLQLALDAFTHGDDALIGLPPEGLHYHGFSVAGLIGGRFPQLDHLMPAHREEIAIDIDRHLRCVTAGIWLTTHNSQPVVVGLSREENHRPGASDLRLEVIADSEAVAAETLDQLAEARHRLNVYRGKVLAFTFSEFGEFGINFMLRSSTTVDDLVLPPAKLASIQRHTIQMAEHRDALRAAGQHLKRGLLLYGPPGTGKTHTINYLMAAMPERTVVILQGPSVGALGHAAAIVRSLPPSMLVIEDVDLIASERSFPPMGGNPLMFQLLNEMDGLGAVDDVLFVLTTNRLDMLESALAARPGRIDHAVEIGVPDDESRRRLLELYLRDVDHTLTELDTVVERTQGVTGAFIKELVRRATSGAIIAGEATLADPHLTEAIDEMLDAATPVHAAMLGGPPTERNLDGFPGHPDLPPGMPPGMMPPPGFAD